MVKANKERLVTSVVILLHLHNVLLSKQLRIWVLLHKSSKMKVINSLRVSGEKLQPEEA